MNRITEYWRDLSDRKRAGFRYAGTAIILIVTVWVAISVTSYLFTWKQDQSALGGAEAVQNAAASSGLSLGHFLVTDSFGLAAYVVLAFLLAWSVKRIWPEGPVGLRKWFYGCLSLSFLLSWILAYAGILLRQEYLFGGGLGGRAAAALVGWMLSFSGEIITALVLVAFAVAWLYGMSPRFSDLLMGRPKPAVTEPDPVEEAPFETSDTFTPEEALDQEEPDEESEEEGTPADETVTEKPRMPRKPRVKTPEKDPDTEITVVTDDTLDQTVTEPLKPIDNRLDPPDGLPKYKTPSLSILGDYLNARHEVSQDELVRNNTKIRNTLASYKIQVQDVTAVVGPTVTLYKVYPAPGVKISAIKQLQEDIGISLQAKGVRITTLSDSVGIEVANDKASIVPLKALLNDAAFRESKAELPVAIG